MRSLVTCVVVLVLAAAGAAHASTGVCDSNPPTTTDACIAAVQSGGSVVNDVFRDKNGRTADQLPLFGVLFNQWPGCDATTFAGCSGQSQAPFDCPGEYVCNGLADTFANASQYANALDRLWWHPCRLGDHTLDANGCPNFTSCVSDGTPGDYNPWEGLVFDLGAQSNQVVIFAENDHGPQPCESTEYTVFLSDNPLARDEVLHPSTDGIDPQKWNRAVLSAVYTKGYVEVRPPDPTGHASCGDTADYSVEEDAFVTVYSLPCGVTFRYAAIVAGNDGLDFAECAYDSQEAELDAVAGLTEDGTAVCPDKDGDGFVDCSCAGAPAVCDCNDNDASVHPGAAEACDDTVDRNCDGTVGGCASGEVCHAGACLLPCTVGEVAFCTAAGTQCEGTDDGLLCVPQDCTQSGCPTGAACENGKCVPDCSGVTCPDGEHCVDGVCVDPCASVVCANGQVCSDGVCGPPCTCLAGDLGCASTSGDVCAASGSCVAPACASVTCDQGQHCDPSTGTCVAQCDGVVCPFGQSCVEGQGCVSKCANVTCTGSLACDPGSGTCVALSCVNVVCGAGTVCADGACVDAVDGGPASLDAGPGDVVDAGSGARGGKGKGALKGCGCGAGPDAAPLGVLVFALALGFVRRRRA